jgi:chromosome segregation ATPase
MGEQNNHEAEILQARERLARAMARLGTLVGGMANQLERFESARADAVSRLKENEALLERERAITQQRDSLNESAKAEVSAAEEETKKVSAELAERDKTIRELNASVELLQYELDARDTKLSEAAERIGNAEDSLSGLKDEHSHIVLQLERLKEERDKAMKDLRTTMQQGENFALKFTQDERLQLLKTIDAIIERVDQLSHQNGRR